MPWKKNTLRELLDLEKDTVWKVGLSIFNRLLIQTYKKNEILIFYVVFVSQWRWNLEVWFYWFFDNLGKLTKIFHISHILYVKKSINRWKSGIRNRHDFFFFEHFFISVNWNWLSESCRFWGYQGFCDETFCPILVVFNFEVLF